MRFSRRSERNPRAYPVVRMLARTMVVLVMVTALFLLYQWTVWPNVRSLASERPHTTAFIDSFRRTNNAQGDSVVLKWEWIDWERVSPNIKAAVLVAEDIEFFSHNGFSLSEIRAAVTEARETGAPPRGASTLTQQLAKNLWLSPSRNPLRKLKEALLAVQLEKTLTKERMFELYLNVVEFGPGIYGVESAANTYYDKSAQYLTRTEAALLAASLSRPSSWNPRFMSPGYVARANRIENLMSQHGSYLERHIGLQPERLAAEPFGNDVRN